MNVYLVLILAILIGSHILTIIIERMNLQRLTPELPAEFYGFYDVAKYAESQSYAKLNTKFGLLQGTIQVIAITAFILSGGFNIADQWVRSLNYPPIVTGIVYIFGLGLAAGILNLPFQIYDTFFIEEKFGFNRTTAKTFILDVLKGLILLLLLGTPILGLTLWFFREVGPAAPLYIWIVITLFQLFMMFLAPILIFPVFNKFTPLEDGELKDGIEHYARKHNFSMKGVFTMDGSRRSSRANAFFTGFGKSRRVVLFDTLLANHSNEELLAILAHEIGHYRLNHMFKQAAMAMAETGLTLYILSLFINNRLLFDAFKMDTVSVYASLIFFGFLYSPISLLISIAMNWFSRQYEYQADRFAVETLGEGKSLITALKKLSVDNLSNLTPHPWKVFLAYSHPPVLERIHAIRQTADNL